MIIRRQSSSVYVRISDASARRYAFTTHCCADSHPTEILLDRRQSIVHDRPSIITAAEPRIAPSSVSRCRRVMSATTSILIAAKGERQRGSKVRVADPCQITPTNADPRCHEAEARMAVPLTFDHPGTADPCGFAAVREITHALRVRLTVAGPAMRGYV